MAFFESHGGDCCGIQHLHCFSNASTADQTFSAQEVEDLEQCREFGLLTEVVLTDSQMNVPRKEVLDGIGFELVSRFVNPNTESTVNVFHYRRQAETTTDWI